MICLIALLIGSAVEFVVTRSYLHNQIEKLETENTTLKLENKKLKEDRVTKVFNDWVNSKD